MLDTGLVHRTEGRGKVARLELGHVGGTVLRDMYCCMERAKSRGEGGICISFQTDSKLIAPTYRSDSFMYRFVGLRNMADVKLARRGRRHVKSIQRLAPGSSCRRSQPRSRTRSNAVP